jgi:predicted transcriptional regulator of viral defense system
MKKNCFCEQEVFAHLWDNADRDGLWTGDASTVAAEFGVSEDEAHDMIGELCDRGLVEKVYPGTYAITKWPERDDSSAEELL